MRRRFMNASSFDYSNYMTIEAIEDVSVLFNVEVQWTTNGRKWETSNRVVAKAGQLVSIKRNTIQGEVFFSNWSEGAYNLKGNIMSLLFGDDAKGKTSMIGNNLLGGLFRNSNVITVEKGFLPATTLTSNCYEYMFQNCSNLTQAPELPATTLATYCYSGMFQGCTSLTTAPALPATTLASNCYGYMFSSCTSLTQAPALPATTLALGCYSSMFQNCSKLSYIKAMFTTTPSTSYTNNWVRGVASRGTFVKNKNATWNVTGVNGIPSGWTVQTATQ